ncbi:MAG TPA: pirin family protein, partial [Lacipirellulaceae bacterium]|nr:pirin family protein [Lacipirellulaceae bacterium]
LLIHQDARIYLSSLDSGKELAHELESDRQAWLQVLQGQVSINGQPLNTSDGAAVSNERLLEIRSEGAAEVMLFDLP